MFFLHFTVQHCSCACRHVEFCYSAILFLLFHNIFGIGETSSVDSRIQFCLTCLNCLFAVSKVLALFGNVFCHNNLACNIALHALKI